jgi:hypothetical protein
MAPSTSTTSTYPTSRSPPSAPVYCGSVPTPRPGFAARFRPLQSPPLISENKNSSSPSDTELIAALTKARIWHVISARGGIDADFSSLNLSPGQRQLFCLAAAALRKSKVVLLDEVTGSVDFETDTEVRTVLEDEFRLYRT